MSRFILNKTPRKYWTSQKQVKGVKVFTYSFGLQIFVVGLCKVDLGRSFWRYKIGTDI